MKFRTLLGHRMLHASRAFAWQGYRHSLIDLRNRRPTSNLHGTRPCLRGSDSVPSVPQAARPVSLHYPSWGTRTYGLPTSPLGAGHSQTHDLAAISDCSRIGLHGLPLRVVGCHPTFHHLAVAYGPCPECLNYISHNRVRVGATSGFPVHLYST